MVQLGKPNDIWSRAAYVLGWEWSHAHGGYTREDHRKPGTYGMEWDDYPSEIDAEEACAIDGIETKEGALEVVQAAERAAIIPPAQP